MPQGGEFGSRQGTEVRPQGKERDPQEPEPE
ncbi:MAG: hypothetical protein QOG72_1148 [Sphingomonadales bacterium]|jgi:hypothetical protein|nr:hypothetical protein [Sphingomonadales bacterium]